MMSVMRRAISRQGVLRLGVAALLLCSVMLSAIGPQRAGAAETDYAYGQWLVVNTDTVTLRNGAGSKNAAIETLTSGEWVMIQNGPLSAEGYTWYQVWSDYGIGWVAGEFLGTSVTWNSGAATTTPTAGSTTTTSSSKTWSYGQWLRVDTDWVTLRSSASASSTAITKLVTGEWVMVKDGPTTAGGYDWYKVYTDYGDGWVAGEFLNTTVTYTGTPGTSGASSSSTTSSSSAKTWAYGQWLRVDTDWVTLRSAAGTSASAITQLTTGEWVMVKDGPTTANGLAWYKVYTDYGDGWVAGQYLNTIVTYTGTPGAASSTTTTSSGSAWAYGQWLRVNTDWVTLRSSSSASSTAITQLSTGEWVMVKDGPVVSGGYSWYKVYTDYGDGWVAGEFLAKTVTYTGTSTSGSSATTSAKSWSYGQWLRVDTDYVTLRSGAGTSFAALKTLVTGEWVMVKEGPTTAGGFQWYKVYTDYGDGWVAGQFLNTSVTYTGTAGTSSSSATSSAAAWGYGQWLRVDTDWVTLRSSASASSTAIETLATGEWVMVKEGPVSAGGYQWYKVYTDYGDGWVAGEFLNTTVTYSGGASGTSSSSAMTYSYGQWLIVDDVNVNLRNGAGTGYTTEATFEQGDWVMIQDGPVSAGGYVWYQVWSDYGVGWVAGQFLAQP